MSLKPAAHLCVQYKCSRTYATMAHAVNWDRPLCVSLSSVMHSWAFPSADLLHALPQLRSPPPMPFIPQPALHALPATCHHWSHRQLQCSPIDSTPVSVQSKRARCAPLLVPQAPCSRGGPATCGPIDAATCARWQTSPSCLRCPPSRQAAGRGMGQLLRLLLLQVLPHRLLQPYLASRGLLLVPMLLPLEGEDVPLGTTLHMGKGACTCTRKRRVLLRLPEEARALLMAVCPGRPGVLCPRCVRRALFWKARCPGRPGVLCPRCVSRALFWKARCLGRCPGRHGALVLAKTGVITQRPLWLRRLPPGASGVW